MSRRIAGSMSGDRRLSGGTQLNRCPRREARNDQKRYVRRKPLKGDCTSHKVLIRVQVTHDAGLAAVVLDFVQEIERQQAYKCDDDRNVGKPEEVFRSLTPNSFTVV